MISPEVKSEIIRYCQRLDARKWVANHDGNITLRLHGGSFAATPTARAKYDLKQEDLIEVDSRGKKLSGNGSPFSEISAHMKVYAERPETNAVIHAHPPNATAVGCANQEMVTTAIPEAVVSIGPGVPLVSLCMPGTDAFLAEFGSLLPHYDAVMVAGNGVFSWGKDLEQAYLRMELVEHLAKIFLKTLPLGGPKSLDSYQVAELLKKREAAGLALPPDHSRSHWFSAT